MKKKLLKYQLDLFLKKNWKCVFLGENKLAFSKFGFGLEPPQSLKTFVYSKPTSNPTTKTE